MTARRAFLLPLSAAWLAVAALAGGCEMPLEVDSEIPVASLGFDQVRHLGTAGAVGVDLDGRGSCDPTGQFIDTEEWELVLVPAGSNAVLTQAPPLRALFEADVPGEYVVMLRVRAGERWSAPDFSSVHVREGNGDDVVIPISNTNACGTPTST